MITDRQIARWRLRSQHLVTPYADSAAVVVGSLLASPLVFELRLR